MSAAAMLWRSAEQKKRWCARYVRGKTFGNRATSAGEPQRRYAAGMSVGGSKAQQHRRAR